VVGPAACRRARRGARDGIVPRRIRQEEPRVIVGAGRERRAFPLTKNSASPPALSGNSSDGVPISEETCNPARHEVRSTQSSVCDNNPHGAAGWTSAPRSDRQNVRLTYVAR
jgi:hypothetical protein